MAEQRVLDADTLRRWRLILGAEADAGLGAPMLESLDQRRDQALDFLYERERDAQEGQQAERHGGIAQAQPTAVNWLGAVRKLFPQSAAEVLQHDALERYQLHGLLTDPEVLAQATPSVELVQTLMGLRHLLPALVLAQAQRMVAQVVAELEARLAPRVQAAFAPRRQLHGRGGRPRLADFDWPRTLRHNLRHYQPESGELVLERVFFRPRDERRLPWHVWIVVDQSGSMAQSVIHSAVMASIFGRLRALKTHLLLFADDVTDATAQLHAPEQLLLAAQLDGGTNIGAALACVRQQLEVPRRSIVVLISDLYEGHSPARVLTEVAALTASGVTTLALAALDSRANPEYDRAFAQQMLACGAQVAAMTPDALVDWLAQRIHQS